jgi:hypothetical protein
MLFQSIEMGVLADAASEYFELDRAELQELFGQLDQLSEKQMHWTELLQLLKK